MTQSALADETDSVDDDDDDDVVELVEVLDDSDEPAGVVEFDEPRESFL